MENIVHEDSRGNSNMGGMAQEMAEGVFESRIYCGPSMPGKGLQAFVVLKNGVPKNLENVFAECLEVERLVVPVEKFQEMQKEIQEEGSPGNIWYRKAVDYYKAYLGGVQHGI